MWYKDKIKVVPSNIGEFLTPLALTIWIMNDGTKSGTGLKLCTYSFSYSECLLLVKVLYDNFNLKASIHSAGLDNQYNIYIWKESMPLLREIVLPYVHSSMKFKLINK
jgi:ubiquinol-cytochrome c reductase cytochrome b subunit